MAKLPFNFRCNKHLLSIIIKLISNLNITFLVIKEYENFSIVRKNKNTGISLHWSNEPYLVSIEQNHKSAVSSSASSDLDLGEENSTATIKLENSLNIYPLKEGKTVINGQGDADFAIGMEDSVTEIDLNDASVRKTHCCLHRLETKVFVQPINGPIQINNRLYESGLGQIELCSGDFLIVGDFYLFQYQNPTDFNEAKPKGQFNLVKLFKMLLLDANNDDKEDREMMLKVCDLLVLIDILSKST